MKIAKRAASIKPSLTLEISAKAKKLREEGRDVVSFGAGEPDFNTPEYICEAAKQAIDGGKTKYTPASGTASLKAAICGKLKADNGLDYSPENIVISNGAKHSLYNAIAALVEDGDEVIIPAPYWLTYPELVRLAGGVPVFVDTKPENGFKITAEELRGAITPRTVALIFNNPNNPSGAVYSEDEVKAIAAVIENTSVTVISDEIYEMLDYTGIPTYSIAKYSEALKAQTVVVNGVSKTYSMTGWRIGFVACEAKLAAAISGMQSHMTSNPNTIAQYAAEAAYSHEGGKAFLEEMKKSFDYRRKLIMEKLDAIPELSYVTPQGAFYIMVNVSKLFGRSVGGTIIGSAIGFAHALLDEADVAVIPCEPFGAPDYVRLSYAVSDEDVRKGVDRIADFVAKFEP